MHRYYNALEELAYDLSWAWDHRTDLLWKTLDPELWALTHNPLVILKTISKERLKEVLSDPYFHNILREIQEKNLELSHQKGCWFHRKFPNTPLKTIAYFSMEFMLSEALPIYSGGLGNVAGDQLKAMNDLAIPTVGIGLLYQQGYFRQVINSEGEQEEFYPYNSPDQLPIRPVRLPNGEWLRIELDFPGWKLWLRTWEVKIGNVKLYLLDSNDLANYPLYRTITSELYGGGTEVRLQQEIVLGIGGFRLLSKLGIQPEVCHLNEGHASFAALERIKQYMEKENCSFDVALSATRAGNLFTTHTAVPAGFDLFSSALLKSYLGSYIEKELKIPFDQFLSLGKVDPMNPLEDFNMAYLAIRTCGAINAVSLLHKKVSQSLFASLFPRWPLEEVPIDYVTNGIHVRSWDSSGADSLWTASCGKSCWLKEEDCIQKNIIETSEETIWTMRQKARKEMIEYGRYRILQILKAKGSSSQEIEKVAHRFSPDILTIGFARRFASYKRPNLLLKDPKRLKKILTTPSRPVQLILAGKAHPKDLEGKRLIKEWIEFIRKENLQESIVFLNDYNVSITEHLVGGVDLWINTPRRPWEACGTSGMKVLVNGGLNLSTLDGWWAESFDETIGWAIGDGHDQNNTELEDLRDAQELYDLLENSVIPCFYERDAQGIPRKWVQKIKKSMATLTFRFSTSRSVPEYVENYYVPAAIRYEKRKENNSQLAEKIATWKKNWEKAELEIKKIEIQTQGKESKVKLEITMKNIEDEMVRFELFAEKEPPISLQKEDSFYFADFCTLRPLTDFTLRAIPSFPGIKIPLECHQIHWFSIHPS